ncbi:hypothetical protein [Serratia plymuthica]|uniref:hypothetical protein n=1 Tax=Serratia plymuthica TaxID=82996 RepID=UPI0014195114|nr:hypothetical protein [Serratia plymuthica]NIC29653.1 hypothetical protein [Serratia plymuthica]
MMKVANNTANSFDLLIDEMRVHAINSLNSKDTVRFSSFTPSTDELNEFYTQALDEVKLPDNILENPDKMTKDQKNKVKDLRDPELITCRSEAEKNEIETKNSLKKLEKDKDNALFDKAIELQRKNALTSAAQHVNSYYDRVKTMGHNLATDAERFFLLAIADEVWKGVRDVYEKIMSAILIAVAAIIETIKSVWAAVENAYKKIYTTISNLLKFITGNPVSA